MTLHLRTLTDEWAKIGRLTRAHRRRGGDGPDRAGNCRPAPAECVRRWFEYFNEPGLDGLEDTSRSGHQPKPRRQLKRRYVYKIWGTTHLG